MYHNRHRDSYHPPMYKLLPIPVHYKVHLLLLTLRSVDSSPLVLQRMTFAKLSAFARSSFISQYSFVHARDCDAQRLHDRACSSGLCPSDDAVCDHSHTST